MSKKEAKAAPDFFSSLPPGFLDNPLTQSKLSRLSAISRRSY